MLRKAISLMLATSLLGGCAAGGVKPLNLPASTMSTAQKAQEKFAEKWTDPAIVREGQPMVVLLTPTPLPKRIANKRVQATLEPDATIKDLAAVLGGLNVSVVIADKAAADKVFYMPKFNGTLGNMLSAISQAADVWFTWQDGAVIVSSKQPVAVTIPQDEALAKKIKEGMGALGLKDALSSTEAGMATFELQHSQYARVKAYFNQMTRNAALVSMQVAIVTVALDQKDNQGIDWASLQAAIGKNSASIFQNNSQGGAAPVAAPAPAPATGSTSTTPTTGTSTPDASSSQSSLPSDLNTLILSSSAAQMALSNKLFSLTGLVNFLGGYGTTETLQNVMLKTVTGNKVELKSVTQIPYVSSVGVTSAAVGSSATVMGSTSTATANDGITLKMTPDYDSMDNTVSLNLDLAIQSVIGFNNLSAGNQIGALTQPTTADRSFNDILRLRPGETVVVGGLTYDSLARNYSSPLGLRGTQLESQDLQVKKQTMFIIIRPTIRTFGALEERPMQAPTEDFSTSPSGHQVVKHVRKAA